MSLHRLYDVTSSCTEPVPFPVVVDELVAGGCVVLGRIADHPQRMELDPRLAEVFSPEALASARAEAERPPAVALHTLDRAAFVVVDSADSHVVIRARTMLVGGELVETVAGSSEAVEHARVASRRSIRRVAANYDLLAAHHDHLANYRLTSPAEALVHDRLPALLDFWEWAADHDERVDQQLDVAAMTARTRVSLGLLGLGALALLALAIFQHVSFVLAGVVVAIFSLPLVRRGLTLRAVRSPRRRPPFVARLTPAHLPLNPM